MKIIIVDDNPVFVDGLQYLLQKEGKHTIVAKVSSGRDFIGLANLGEADIVITEINLPGIDGITASKKVLSDHPNLNIIAVTLYKGSADVEELEKAGIKGCVYKTEIFSQMDKAIQKVSSGKKYFTETTAVV